MKTQNSPTVTILYPNGGEILGKACEVKWSANDPDGDKLSYAVLYSGDGGKDWTAVAVNLQETSYTLALSQMTGREQCLVKVVAMDGFNIGCDQSDEFFSVGDRTPSAPLPPPPASSIIDQALLLDSIPPSPWNQKNVFAPGDTIYVWVETKVLNKPHNLEIVWINPSGKEIQREKSDLRGWGAGETVWSEMETGPQTMQGKWKIVILVNGRVDRAMYVFFKP